MQVARTQDTDYSRVVRLSRAEGHVLVSHADTEVWEDAPVNLPLQAGDTLATQDGLAEVEFENGATAYLAENSVLQFAQLGFSSGGRATALNLTQGTGTFYANLSREDLFSVQARTFNVAIPERAEFRVDGFSDGAAVQVFSGNVSVSTLRGSTNLEKEQSVAVHEKDFQDFSIGSLPNAEDAFDQWVNQEGEMIRAGNKNTLNYIHSPNDYGLSDLSRYGTWVNIAGFGFSWRPFSVGFTWTPYFNGKWILDSHLGWIWVSSEPWGWMPYHFGSWLLSPNLGWVWVPGGPAGLRHWEPSRVNWVTVGNQVGWVAKSPNDRDGVPANAARSIIMNTGRPRENRLETHEVVTEKDLRSVAPLKQPPAEFALRTTKDMPHAGIPSTNRMAPWTQNNNPSIVYDRGTRTYVNREATFGNAVIQPGQGHSPPVTAPGLMPRLNSGGRQVGSQDRQAEHLPGTQSGVSRLALPLGATDSRTGRIILPPPYPTVPALHGNVPSNGVPPSRPQMPAPLNAPPRMVAPPPGAPRPVTMPPTPPQPSARHTPPAQSGSAPRPATQTPQAAPPRTTTDHH
jgi:hypothetical protein